jgi:hypothetical protein
MMPALHYREIKRTKTLIRKNGKASIVIKMHETSAYFRAAFDGMRYQVASLNNLLFKAHLASSICKGSRAVALEASAKKGL